MDAGLLLRHPLHHRLGGAVHQILGLLQAQAGEGPNLLDDLDLLLAGRGQDDVELGLLLGLLLGGSAARSPRPGHAGDRHGRCGLDAELLLDLLGELGGLDDREPLDPVQDVVNR